MHTGILGEHAVYIFTVEMCRTRDLLRFSADFKDVHSDPYEREGEKIETAPDY
jgi:hypothetical protein